MSEIAKGLYVNELKENTPDFVKLRFSAKVEDAIETLQKFKNEKGYVNFDVLEKKDKTGMYITVNDFKPKQEGADEIDPTNIPF